MILQAADPTTEVQLGAHEMRVREARTETLVGNQGNRALFYVFGSLLYVEEGNCNKLLG